MPTTATPHGTRTRPIFLSVAFVVLLVSIARAQQQPPAAGQESGDLAKQLSNPIASLVSLPFQFNWEQNVGPSKLTRFVLNVQPVMPFTVNDKVNLIVRLIAPFISQPPLAQSGTATFDMGDITTSFFVSPSKAGKLIWGAGPGDRPAVHERPRAWQRKVECGPDDRCLDSSRTRQRTRSR